MPWVKGQSGNPGGRQKEDPALREAAKAQTMLAIKTLVRVAKDKNQPAAARVMACNALLDRGHGKPAQTVDVKHDGTLRTITDGVAAATAIAAELGIPAGPAQQTPLN